MTDERKPSLGKCAVCGTETDEHTGTCHFGWHNPDSCPDATAEEPRCPVCEGWGAYCDKHKPEDSR